MNGKANTFTFKRTKNEEKSTEDGGCFMITRVAGPDGKERSTTRTLQFL